MRSSHLFFAALFLAACGGTGTVGTATPPADAGSSGTVPHEGDASTTTDGGADSAPPPDEPAVLTPRYDITIAGAPVPVTQLFVRKDSDAAAGHHAPSIQGLFMGNGMPGADPSREGNVWLTVSESLPKGAAECALIDITIYYYLPTGDGISVRPLNPGGSCTVMITEQATGEWTAGSTSGFATALDGSHKVAFSLKWAQKNVD